ncbi:hypothetical protein Tco_0462275 [Tanacetum coccineum]
MFRLESPFPFLIPVADSDSFLEESDTSLSHLDNSLPEFETFSNHTEETRSGSFTTHINKLFPKLPEFESFHFDPSFPRPPSEPPDAEICLNFESDTPVIGYFEELNEDQRGSENVLFQNVEDDDNTTSNYTSYFLTGFHLPRGFSLLSCSKTGSGRRLRSLTWDLHLEPWDYWIFGRLRAHGFVHFFELHISAAFENPIPFILD